MRTRVLAALALCACTSHPAPAPTRLVYPPTARGGGPQALASTVEALEAIEAIDAITDARCDHLERCGQVGRGRRFLTQEHCRRALAEGARTQWNAETCASGYFEADEVAGCLRRVRQASCGVDVEGLCSAERACSL